MSTGARDQRLSSTQFRHALRTPLNHIAGYSEMLIEDLPADCPPQVRGNLQKIQDAGREIIELLPEALPPELPEITPLHLEELRNRLQLPLDKLTTGLASLVGQSASPNPTTDLADLLRIGAAVTELLDLAGGRRNAVASSQPPLPSSGVTAPTTTGDILVVDDNAGNRDLLERMLTKHGFRCSGAPSGEAALQRIAQGGRFDLILLDLMMPGIDGLQVLERLKTNPASRLTPIIMLSALDETTRVIRSLEIGAEDYVLKPFDPILLIARLRSSLERSRLRAAETTRARELELAYERLRENERRLKESEERLRLATEAAEVGIWYYYARSNKVIMTTGCKRLFGLPEDEESLTFEQVRECIHPEDRDRTDEEARRALARQAEYDIEYRTVWRDSSTHWIASRGQAQGVDSGSETRLAGVAFDISSRKQAEEALRQAGKLESIGLLAGGIAHDFNNLLTGIIGSASFVMDNLSADDPNAYMLQNVVDAGERAAALTRQLLAYSGKGKFSVRRLDISELVNDIATLLRASIERSVMLERQLDRNLPRIEADETQVQQIVMNLVINGAEAISADGTVWVRTGLADLGSGDRAHFVFGEDIPAGPYVYLEVQDTGCGMERKILDRIFDPFFTTKFTGRGLGLAAVLGIVRGHQGAVEVHTAPGHGSTFRVYFSPALGEAVLPPQREEEEDVPPTVLFIDDEEVVMLMGKTALERAGFQVFVAETGEKALNILKEKGKGISVAVVDLTMPGWSGFETYRRMRQIRPDLAVILSSGYSDTEIRAKYPREEIGEILHKPYSASALVGRVKERLV